MLMQISILSQKQQKNRNAFLLLYAQWGIPIIIFLKGKQFTRLILQPALLAVLEQPFEFLGVLHRARPWLQEL